MTPENIVPFLVPGRLLKIKISGEACNQDWGWGILASYSKQKLNPKHNQAVGRKNKSLIGFIEENDVHYILDVYLYVKNKLTTDNECQPGDPEKKNGRLGIVPVVLHASTVQEVSSV